MKISVLYPLLANIKGRSKRLQPTLHFSSLSLLRKNVMNGIGHFIVFLFVVNALCGQVLFAQTVVPKLIGMALYGGTSGEGTIFSINPDGTDLKAIYNFPGWRHGGGRLPYGSVIQASNGSLYGMTATTLFKIKHDGTGHKVLHNFSYPTGVGTDGSLMQATNGMLYGMASMGGFLGYGTIFRINMDGSDFSVIHHFNGSNGGYPSVGSLIQGRDGALYGMSYGGAANRGVVFKLNLDGSSYRVLHHFTNPGGAVGSVIQARNGSLYGMLNDAGIGAIFKIETDGSGFKVLHILQGSEGGRPHNSLIEGPDGNLYGLAYEGGNYGRGTIVKIQPDGTNFTVVHHFDLINGAHPSGDLMVYNNNLYGFTSHGGENKMGVVFKYNLATSTFLKLAEFNHETGHTPRTGKFLLVYPSAAVETPTDQANTITFSNVLAKSMTVSFTPGNGSKHLAIMKIGSAPTFQPVDNTTYTGGLGTGQTVVYNGTESSFDLTGLRPDREYYIKIFSYNTDDIIIKYMVANAPIANRHTTTTTEKFYGMASNGGAAYRGTIFRFDADGTSPLSIMHNFRNNDGRHPFGQLIEAKDGALYGMNSGGILNLTNDPIDSRYGTIFRISPDGTRYTILRRLSIPDGSSPRGSLIQASNSVLYGMAQSGGTAGYGTVFRINTDGSNFRVLHNFTGKDGKGPVGSLLQASNGVLYGMTPEGGSLNIGVLFKININGSGFQVLRHFTAPHEQQSNGSLIQGPDGFLYGTTKGGSSTEAGSIFKIKMDGTSYTSLYKFPTYRDGSPEGSLTQTPDGTLYGTAVGDNTNTSPEGFGNIFKINPDGSGYVIVHYFNGANGSLPRGNLTLHDNKLFGFTSKGGVNDDGVIFNYDLTTATYKKLHDLNGRSTGSNPISGNLIGVNAPDPEVNFVVLPANNTLHTALTRNVTANLVAGAATYTIELNTDPAFGAATAIQSTGGRTQTFSNLKPGTIYYNRVKTNVTPHWGPTRQFSTGDALTLAFIISPVSNATNASTSPVVEANTIPGATTYTIQLSPDPNFGSVMESSGNSTKLNFSGLETDTKYYARVRTDLVPDSWGPVRAFTTGNALSLSYVRIPANNASGVSTIVNVTSNTVPGASSYTIQLSENATFSSIAFQSTSSSATTNFSGLKYNTKYYNRVRTNLTTAFGDVRSFTTRTAESMAYVTSPANNTTNVKTTSFYIVSNSVPGATSYTIQLSESSDFRTIAFQRTGNTRSLPFTGLKYNTRYYNRVLTNLTSVYGQVRSFTTMMSTASARLATAETDSKADFIDMNINVYPNPFRENLIFYIESASNEADVMLIDMNGQTLHESVEKTNSLIEVSDPFPVGVYFLKIDIGRARKIVKVVKMQ